MRRHLRHTAYVVALFVCGYMILPTSAQMRIEGIPSLINKILTIGTDPDTTGLYGLVINAALPIETHSPFANGAQFYTHSDTGFRAPTMYIARSRGTKGAPELVSSGDYIGYYHIAGHDGSVYANGAETTVRANCGDWSLTNHGAQWQLNTARSSSTTPAASITVGCDGFVGIGANSSPAADFGLPLAAEFEWDNSIQLDAPTDGALRIKNQANTSIVTLRANGVPTCSSNCGTSPAVVGTDTAMTVTMGTSGSPASGWVITFTSAWASAPSCAVQMGKAGMVVGKLALTVVTSTTIATVVTNGTAPATTDVYHMQCFGVS